MRLIKGARNCEHASNVAREPDDRDIRDVFLRTPIVARDGSLRWKFTVDAPRREGDHVRDNNEKLVLF